ncbi:tyrosine-protein phosphatase non-receptor type 2 [Striga asiatica]|uniref:Tyrosine-protein phosphatase non-receptor type 2 n=1 Tax=Striga asiatica TaxID=4170 RepID=A0A5A7RG74_STRAF|nr:tyrosine-protein phosphatase non-receptor type 2 [Striga asiatica]
MLSEILDWLTSEAIDFDEKADAMCKHSTNLPPPAEAANGSGPKDGPPANSAKRNSAPNPRDCCKVWPKVWYLRTSASLTLLRANFIDSSKWAAFISETSSSISSSINSGFSLLLFSRSMS